MANISKITSVKGYSKSGVEIEKTSSYDKTTGTVSFASEPAGIVYKYNTGFNNNQMSVAVYDGSLTDITPEDDDDDDDDSSDKGGSGGCDAGFGGAVLLLLMLLLFPKGVKAKF